MTYILIGGPLTQVFKTLVASRFVRQNLTLFLTRRNLEDLAVLRDLLETGKITPVLDRSYRLSEAAAFRYLEEGHARGKVVVTMWPALAVSSRSSADLAAVLEIPAQRCGAEASAAEVGASSAGAFRSTAAWFAIRFGRWSMGVFDASLE